MIKNQTVYGPNKCSGIDSHEERPKKSYLVSALRNLDKGNMTQNMQELPRCYFLMIATLQKGMN
jgi:hypothetical protein